MELNVSQNTICRYEAGEREAGYAMLIRIADYFDVSVDYLLGRTDTRESTADLPCMHIQSNKRKAPPGWAGLFRKQRGRRISGAPSGYITDLS